MEFTRRRFMQTTAAAALAFSFLPQVSNAQQALRVRKSVTKMDSDDPFFTEYAAAVKAMHDLGEDDQRNWRNQALIHGNHCPHGNPNFLYWHRHYITIFEQICGELIGNANFALPYWDWTDQEGILPDPFFDDENLNVEALDDKSDVQTNMFGFISTEGYRLINKARGLQNTNARRALFSERNMGSIKSERSFSRFESRLSRSPHNSVHTIISGHMGNGMSPLDPCFWLHHCNVDRIWAERASAGYSTPKRNDKYEGQFVDKDNSPIDVDANSAIDFEKMGFTYDTIAVDDPIVDIASVGLLERVSRRLVFNNTSSLGFTDVSPSLMANQALDFDVPTSGLVKALDKKRTFKQLNANHLGIEKKRILAVLKNVKASGDTNGLMINVFVNGGENRSAPLDNSEQYADSFSFFGNPPGHGEHSDGQDIIVDLTIPLRKQNDAASLSKEDLKINLVPVYSEPDKIQEVAVVDFSSIELLAT